jgi:signal transduction histidine kinase
VGFRGKQIATLTLVAGAVALATSLMNAASLARLGVVEIQSRAALVAQTLYHQAGRVIRQQGGEDIRTAIGSDASLRNYVEAVVGYSPTTLYVAITDNEGFTILHSDPRQEGTHLSPAESLTEFSGRSPLAQVWALGRGHHVLEVRLPFLVDGRPFGSIRVASSSLFLKEELSGAIASNAALAAGVVLVSFLASFYLANRLLAPIEMLRRELARIDTGEEHPPLDFRSEEDVGRIAEFFSSMSRRLAEDRRLRESGEAWLETMLGGLADAVMVVGRERRILSLNQSACDLLERTRAELQGRPLGEVLAADHPLSLMIEEAFAREEAVGARSLPLTIKGREALHTLTAQVLGEPDGVFGVMVTARDMERLSQLGSHLSYSQKLAALGSLTSGVAHEIKNPLNAMVIHVALLRQKLAKAGPEAAGYLDVLEGEIRRLDRVIQGFLTFTRPEKLQLEAVSMKEVLAEATRLLAGEVERNGICMETDIDPDLPPVYGDRELLQQAFLNLVVNACEAMPEGGKLQVTAHRPDEGRIVLGFEDSGVGIEPEELPKIFDLYYTTKNGGSGIGLSMVYRIVQLHDGHVQVSSTPGEGTRFTIDLPEVRG